MLLIKDTECIKCHNIEDVFAESEQVCNQQNSPIKQRLTKEMTFAILEKNFHEKKNSSVCRPYLKTISERTVSWNKKAIFGHYFS